LELFHEIKITKETMRNKMIGLPRPALKILKQLSNNQK